MKIELKFKNTLAALSGYEFGKLTYEEQAKEKITNLDEKITFIFPDSIVYLGSSFVQGFFVNLINEIGFRGVENIIEIQSNNPKVSKEEVIKKLFEGTR